MESIPKIIVFDLDGVICREVPEYKEAKIVEQVSLIILKKYYQEKYKSAVPIKTTISLMKGLKKRGHSIIIYTSRWKEDRPLTLYWLKKHEVPFDELVMGKPWGHYYIDDRSISIEDLGLELKAPVMKEREE